ncbi:MAG: hypothetical protein AABW41_04920 [Nanoarchaeota archaeon]
MILINEIVLHLLVPLVVIRIFSLFYKLDKKAMLFLSTFTLIPDIDFFIGWHRATFHNLFFGAFLVLISLLFFKNYSKIKTALIGSYFFLSHIVLDGFFIAWFYPIQRFHYDLFTGATSTLKAMNDARPHFSNQYILIGITAAIIVYALLIYEAYFRKNN